MQYQILAEKNQGADRDPTLTEMMEAAVKKLAANTKDVDDGYFLLVEG